MSLAVQSIEELWTSFEVGGRERERDKMWRRWSEPCYQNAAIIRQPLAFVSFAFSQAERIVSGTYLTA